MNTFFTQSQIKNGWTSHVEYRNVLTKSGKISRRSNPVKTGFMRVTHINGHVREYQNNVLQNEIYT